MRYTLIELTQRILESMDSDEVSSITDSVESLAVANIIKECYFDILSNQDLPEGRDIFQLTASGDNTKPTLMTKPSNVLDVNKVMYNNNTVADPVYYEVYFKEFYDFLDHISSYDVDEDNVESMTITNGLSQSFTFKYRNDQLPGYYTSFDDSRLIFDSFDETANSTLVGAKTLCEGMIEPTFTMSDSYTPDLDPRQFQLLLQAAKAQAFIELKQVENPKAEKKERRNIITAQRTKNNIDRRTGMYRGYGRK